MSKGPYCRGCGKLRENCTRGIYCKPVSELTEDEKYGMGPTAGYCEHCGSAYVACTCAVKHQGNPDADLTNRSTEELEAELQRRREPQPPQPVENPDFTALIAHVVDHVTRIHTEGREHDDDEHYAYEEAMKAVFGDNIFDWICEKLP